MRKTKIICTIGPAVDTDDMLRQLMINGMDCARMNFSHGTHEEHLVRIDRVKRIRKELNKNIPILLDTKGPEIRIKDFEKGSVELEEGQTFTFYAKERLGDESGVSVTYEALGDSVSKGTVILIDDGKIEVVVTAVEDSNVVCKVMNGGKISNRKSINIPNVRVDMPYISEKDRSDILFGIENDIDFIAASFVRTAEDVLELRKLLNENGGEKIQIIAKIENGEGVNNLDKIIELSDGVMVARGDMGVELPYMMLPKIQKDMIKKCYRAGKHVITATQMLESMTHSPRPTRAEVSDVANAIYDGTTAIMLSGETAAGEYPIESVRTMSEIAESTEQSIRYHIRYERNKLDLGHDILNAISNSACSASYRLNAKAIVALSRTGRTAKQLSNYRPACPILAAVLNEKACRQLSLAWNVRPILSQEKHSTDDLLQQGIRVAVKEGIAAIGDTIVLTCSAAIGGLDTDLMKVHVISEEDLD